ncbi:MAG TPA: AAA family ATPase, partial [Longimicrobium sp.]|nr:AAA family ATPase [Longimicrobium sp.]
MQADFFRLAGMPPRMQELLDRMHAADPDRWLPRRLILQNYWMFEEPEVFHFGRGNLMLTGQNESGKSTVLVTAITLVLDMMLTPDRVDTMGSNDRSIRYYLVGKDDAQEGSPFWHRERTAYIALEFERGRSGVFHTIGIGLRSSRDWTNQKLERWGFVMDGSQRVEEGFHLHESGRPLRPGELRTRLGRAGQVFDDQRAYKAAVNETLFGFHTVEDYERFLEMLHVVRTPKLGEGLNPKKVEALLKESLPPIQSTAIDGASDVFSKLDTIEDELGRLQEQLSVARELEGPQEAAVLAAARRAGAAYRQALGEHGSRRKAHEKLLAQLESAHAEVERQTEVRALLASERAEKQGRLTVFQEQHRTHGAVDIEARLKEVRAEQRDAAAAYEGLRTDRRKSQDAADREQEALRQAGESWTRQRGRLGEKLEAVAAAARRAFWPSLEQRSALAGDALGTLGIDADGVIAGDLARSVIDSEAQQRRGVLDRVLGALEAVAAAGGRLDGARKASDVARREYSHADDRFRTTSREAESARGAAAAALGGWRAECVELPVPDAAFGAALAALEGYDPQGRRPTALLAPLQPVHDEAQEALRSDAQELGIQRRRRQEEVEEVDARLRRLSSERDVEPDRTPAQAAARRLLREHGIPHAPLFATCDLAGALAANAALTAHVEAALLDAGLLDALVVPRAETGRVRALLDGHGLGDRWIAPPDESRDGTGADGDAAGRWLTPVASAELSEGDVGAALRTLGLAGDGGGGGVVDAGGGWRLGPLHGLAPTPSEARVRFLGETARREERRRRIDEARRQLAELREALGGIEEQMEAVRARQRTLEREWRAAHDLVQLQAVHDRLLAVRREEHERERRRAAAEMAAEAVEAATREVQQQTAALERATDDAPWLKGRARSEVDAAAAALAELLSVVRAIGDDVERMDELRRAYAARMRAHDELRVQIEELAPRIARADVRVQTLDAQLNALNEQLSRANVGREVLASEIAALVKRLEEIGEAETDVDRIINKTAGQIESWNEQEPDYADQLRRAFINLQAVEFDFR